MNIYNAGTVAIGVDNNEETVIAYINGNQGKTQAEIVTATSVDPIAVRYILQMYSSLKVIVAVPTGTNNPVYYTAGTWSTNVWSQRANAREWINETGTFSGYSNMGKSETQMVADFAAEGISIDFGIALALFRMLVTEGNAQVV